MTACTSDDDFVPQPEPDNSTLVSVSMSRGDWYNGRPESRAASTSDVGACKVVQPHSIGVWGYYYMEAGQYGALSAIDAPIPNDYRVFDYKEVAASRPTKYTSDDYKFLANHRLPYDPTNPAHKDPSTADLNYSQGDDRPNELSGGFPWENAKYKFYCYAPHVSDIEENRGTSYAMAASLDQANTNMETLTLSNVPSISNQDIVVAKQPRVWRRLQSPGDPTTPYGSCVIFNDEGTPATDYRLIHLYSAVQFCFALDESYAEQRYLHIKKVTITTDERLTNELGQNINTTYTVTKDLTDPTADVVWGDTPAANTGTPLTVVIGEWDTDRQFILGTAFDPATQDLRAGTSYPYPALKNTERYYPFGNLYLVPQKNCEHKYSGGSVVEDLTKRKTFNIVVTYDVYDHTGQKTRENATAASVLTFPNTGDNAVERFQAGYYYNAYIKINPDFLYVLSDNDAISDIVITGGK